MDSFLLEFGHVHWCKFGFQSKIKNRFANSEDPDETAYYEHSYLFSSGKVKGLTNRNITENVIQC